MTTIINVIDLGRRVRQGRKDRRWTQATLAAAAGVSRFTLIKLERGQLNDINLKTTLALLRALRLQLIVDEIGAVGLQVLGDRPIQDRGRR